MKEVVITGRKISFGPGFQKVNPEFFSGPPPNRSAPPEPPRSKSKSKSDPGPKLNKLERARVRLLEIEERAGRISHLKFQSITLRLGYDCRYTPDCTYLENGRLVAEEIKGPYEREDARVKRLAAAAAFPWIEFRLVRRDPYPNGPWAVSVIRQ